MQVSIETTGALERRMEVSVPRERIEQAIDERLKRVSRTAKLKGFRPGKVPLKVVKQQFGAQVRQEVLSDLMQTSFAEAVSQEKLNPAAGPRIEPLSVGPDEDLRYRATFEVFPEIDLQGVEGIAVVRPAAEVTDADVDAMVLNLREQRPRFDVVERESREGDRVTMDFEGQVDGAPFEGSKGDDVAVLLGGGRMLKDFETGITGMKADERRQVSVPYPADYHNPALAGKAATFDVHVKKVEERRLPELDDEFCREYGVLEGGSSSCAARSREHGARARGQRAGAPQAAVARRPAEGESRGGPEGLRGRAGAGNADGGGAPDRRDGRFAGAVRRFVRGNRAPTRGARPADPGTGQEPRRADRPGPRRGAARGHRGHLSGP